MRRLIQRLATRGQLWIYRTSEVARFDGIILADVGNRRAQTPHFLEILLAALRLLKDADSQRFARVRRRISWIVNCTLGVQGAAEYQHAARACAIDFQEPTPVFDPEFLVGWYACTLVHEATHGEIRSRGVLYTVKLRSRIERLCVEEEQRFILSLTITRPELASRLYREFDAAEWKQFWAATAGEKFRAQLRRILGT